MSQEIHKRIKLRAYLLGALEDREAEREEIEEQLVIDGDFLQLLLSEEEELNEAFVAGELSADEREKFENHYLLPAERRQEVKLDRLLKKYANDDWPREAKENPAPGPFTARLGFLLPVAVAFAVLVLGVIVFWGFFTSRPDAEENALASLNKAYATERPLESRITKFDYAPYNKTRSQDDAKVASVEEDRAERISLDEVAEKPTAKNQHLLARVYLGKKELEKALRLLEEAQRGAPQDPEIISDIGTVYLEKSKTGVKGDEKLTMIATAIEYFDKALAIKPDLLPARFNKSMATEIYLPNRAKEAWQEYLNLDQSSGWADEARRHLEELNRLSQQDTSDDIELAFMRAFKEQNDEEAFQIASRNRELINGKYLPQKLATSIVSKKKMIELRQLSF